MMLKLIRIYFWWHLCWGSQFVSVTGVRRATASHR